VPLKKDHMRRLNYFLNSKRDVPFEWGEWDCCVFAADAVKVMTGEDKLKDFRGLYSNKYEAARLLRDKGEGTLVKTAIKVLGAPIFRSRALRGDVVIINNNIGICTGQKAVFVGENGLLYLPMAEATHCFSIR
jgi:hypothetical protein